MIVNKHNHDVTNSLVWRRKTGIASRGIYKKNYVVRISGFWKNIISPEFV